MFSWMLALVLWILTGVGSSLDWTAPFIVSFVYFAQPVPELLGSVAVLTTMLTVKGSPASPNRRSALIAGEANVPLHQYFTLGAVARANAASPNTSNPAMPATSNDFRLDAFI